VLRVVVGRRLWSRALIFRLLWLAGFRLFLVPFTGALFWGVRLPPGVLVWCFLALTVTFCLLQNQWRILML